MSNLNYSAFTTDRSAAAKNRNYSNCIECKKSRQKCEPTDSGTCERCKKYGKKCVISGGPSRVDIPTAMDSKAGETVVERQFAHDKKIYGNIFYLSPYNNGERVQVIYVKVDKNDREQVYKVQCDKDFVPLGLPEYLGPRDEFENKLYVSMAYLSIDDMWDVKVAFGL